MITTQFAVNEIFPETEEDLSLSIFEDGGAASPSDASYILYDSGKNEQASGSITPSTNTLTVTVTDSLFDSVEENCFVQFTFTVSSKVYVITEYFDVVKRKVYCNVIDSDLQKYYPNLDDYLWDGETDYENQIQLAWRDVQVDIKNRGNRAGLIPNDSAIKRLIELKAFVHIFEAFIKQPGDLWDDRRERAEEKYREEFNKTRFRYDADDDLTIDRTGTFGNRSLIR